MPENIIPQTSRLWTGENLETGSKIAIRARRYKYSDGIQGWSEDFPASAGMLFKPFRFSQSEPYEEFLEVDPAFVTIGSKLTIETWPKVDGESFYVPDYVKCILQGENGKYLELNSGGSLKASADRDTARVFCLTSDPSRGTAIYDAGYHFGQRESFDRTLNTSQQNGQYTLMPLGCPPHAPYILNVIQGFNTLDIIVVGQNDWG